MGTFLEGVPRPAVHRFFGWQALFGIEHLSALLRPKLMPQGESRAEAYGRHHVYATEMLAVHGLLYLNCVTSLPDDLNVEMGRMSMAHGRLSASTCSAAQTTATAFGSSSTWNSGWT